MNTLELLTTSVAIARDAKSKGKTPKFTVPKTVELLYADRDVDFIITGTPSWSGQADRPYHTQTIILRLNKVHCTCQRQEYTKGTDKGRVREGDPCKHIEAAYRDVVPSVLWDRLLIEQERDLPLEALELFKDIQGETKL